MLRTPKSRCLRSLAALRRPPIALSLTPLKGTVEVGRTYHASDGSVNRKGPAIDSLHTHPTHSDRFSRVGFGRWTISFLAKNLTK